MGLRCSAISGQWRSGARMRYFIDFIWPTSSEIDRLRKENEYLKEKLRNLEDEKTRNFFAQSTNQLNLHYLEELVKERDLELDVTKELLREALRKQVMYRTLAEIEK